MKLLIVTQKVDKEDDNLGPFYYWFEELAKKFDSVVIIASTVGAHNLPSNVMVCGLGKERGVRRLSRLHKFLALFAFHYAKTDAVLFHQIPEYVLAASPFLLSLKKKRALWYAHGAVSKRLALAERLVDYVFTSSPAGFRLPSKKVISVGQAVDTRRFSPSQRNGETAGGLRMITVGRIAPVKNFETLISALAILKNSWDRPWMFSVIGGPILSRDYQYFERLKTMVADGGLVSQVHFYGSRPFSEIPGYYGEHDMFINLSLTGSLDKAVLEAMASGLTVVSSNEAYRAILPPTHFLERASPDTLAERIKTLAHEPRPQTAFREIVRRDHGLERTIEKIAAILKSDL